MAPKIKVYDDLIDEALVNDALNIIRRYGFRYGWKSNNEVSFRAVFQSEVAKINFHFFVLNKQ